ncbi:MAG TPA: c-type cytochrome [Gemmatimonadaceae bacterium]
MRTDHGKNDDQAARAPEGRGHRRTPVPLLTGAALLVVLVVGVARRPQPADEGSTTRAGRGGVASPTPVTTHADTISPAMIALGERVFQGKSGGALCTTCHGKDAKGMKGLGPDLTDDVWLHGDGGMEFLKTLISTGVMQPKLGGVVMPPYGGTPLSPDQLEAVAAYVYSLSHG